MHILAHMMFQSKNTINHLNLSISVCFEAGREANGWGDGSVNVWGGISFRQRTERIGIDETINTHRNVTWVLRPATVWFFSIHHDVTKFQQDNGHM